MFDNSRHNFIFHKRQKKKKKTQVISSLENERRGKGKVKTAIYLKCMKFGISFLQ